jgi:hypothetical protein
MEKETYALMYEDELVEMKSAFDFKDNHTSFTSAAITCCSMDDDTPLFQSASMKVPLENLQGKINYSKLPLLTQDLVPCQN